MPPSFLTGGILGCNTLDSEILREAFRLRGSYPLLKGAEPTTTVCLLKALSFQPLRYLGSAYCHPANVVAQDAGDAGRAGEVGTGSTVVAQNVRELAQRSAKDIQVIVKFALQVLASLKAATACGRSAKNARVARGHSES
jgi:hypothetical protein